MKAINISHPKLKLGDIAKSLYLENGWKMPEGFRDKSKKNPLNYTRAQWQQAKRIGRRPEDIKREMQECWNISDSKQGFSNAMQEFGYYLAQGDRRGFVAVDVRGEVYSLTRQLGQKKKVLEGRLGSYKDLPTVSDVKTKVEGRLSKLFKGFSDELKLQHERESRPLEKTKKEMVLSHRADRKRLNKFHQERWQAEELKRSARIRSGFKGLWDKINGRYWKNRKINEREAWLAYQRDQKEREELISKQLVERQNLQTQIKLLREKQKKEQQELSRDLSHLNNLEQNGTTKTPEKTRSSSKPRKMPKSELEFDLDLPKDTDLEPEI